MVAHGSPWQFTVTDPEFRLGKHVSFSGGYLLKLGGGALLRECKCNICTVKSDFKLTIGQKWGQTMSQNKAYKREIIVFFTSIINQYSYEPNFTLLLCICFLPKLAYLSMSSVLTMTYTAQE